MIVSCFALLLQEEKEPQKIASSQFLSIIYKNCKMYKIKMQFV